MPAESGNLIVRTSRAGDEVFIHGRPEDLRGFARLLIRLADAAERGESPHGHLFSAEWGGCDLAGGSIDGSSCAVHHIKVYGWPVTPSVPDDGA